MRKHLVPARLLGRRHLIHGGQCSGGRACGTRTSSRLNAGRSSEPRPAHSNAKGVGRDTFALFSDRVEPSSRGPQTHAPSDGLFRSMSAPLSLELVAGFLVFALTCVPLGWLVPQRSRQTLRPGWSTDVLYFVAGCFVGRCSDMTNLVVVILIRQATGFGGVAFIAAQPGWLQFIEIFLLSDFLSYVFHRCLHSNRFLWRLHSVHHSSHHLDWLANVRLHPLEKTLGDCFQFLPIFALGFSDACIALYVIVLGFQSFLNHANIQISFGPLRWIVVSPQFHHWHHGDDPAVYNRNFGQHLVFFDLLFGTAHIPAEHVMPTLYGVREQVPDDFWSQLVYPFRRPLGNAPAGRAKPSERSLAFDVPGRSVNPSALHVERARIAAQAPRLLPSRQIEAGLIDGAEAASSPQELRERTHFQLSHHPAAVNFHRLLDDAQFESDLLVQSPPEDQLKYIPLPRRQPREKLLQGPRCGAVPARLFILRDRARDGVQDRGILRGLRQIVDRPGLHRPDPCRCVVMAAQEYHLALSVMRVEPFLHLQAVQAVHDDVQDRASGNVGVVFTKKVGR